MKKVLLFYLSFLFLLCAPTEKIRPIPVVNENGDKIIPPIFIKKFPLTYTKEMFDNKIEGVVKVKALIGVNGRVKKTEIINDLGYGAGEAAIKAIKNYRFKPATKNGEKFEAWIIIPVRYTLNDAKNK